MRMGVSARKIGVRIRALREERKIGLRTFAMMVGVDKSHLCDIEHGKKDIRLSTLDKILAGLDISYEEFFAGIR